MKMLCAKKYDQWKCSGGYDQAYKNLILTSLIKSNSNLQINYKEKI